MKKTILISMLAIAAIFYAGEAAAQKIAHINSNDLLQMMPEVKAAKKQLEVYSSELSAQYENMGKELDKKLAEYDEYSKKPDASSAIIQLKDKEIRQLQERIQTFRETAQESVQSKEQELLEPIIKKAKEAVQAVAKELGYSYVIDTSTGALIMYPEADNLMQAVKKRLGITAEDKKPGSPTSPAPAPKK
jgi:outer membrane protein